MAARFPFGLFSILLAMICFIGSTAAIAQKKHPPTHSIDLNTAKIEELEQLPGIAPRTAEEIVRFREKSGPFERVEDLLAIRGITKKRLEKLRPYVYVKPVPPAHQ